MLNIRGIPIIRFPSLTSNLGEEMADIQAMFNATRPWLLQIKGQTSYQPSLLIKRKLSNLVVSNEL